MKVLKFGAVWCVECLVMRPLWEEIEKENSRLETEYFDVDENQEMVKKYEIKTVPTFIFLDKNGEELLRLKGAQNKKDLEKAVEENMSR